MTPSHFRSLPPRRSEMVLLAAWAPLPDDDDRLDDRRADRRPGAPSPALRRAALVAAVRAVCAAGCELVLPADAVIAPIAAAVAHPYAAPPATERHERPRRPLTVVETTGPHAEARALLAPWVAAEVVSYGVLSDGEPREPTDAEHAREAGVIASGRQPVTDALLLARPPIGAFLIESGRYTLAELERLQEHHVPVAAFAETTDDAALADAMREHDPLAHRDREAPLRWESEPLEPEGRQPRRRDQPAAPPFAYALQRQLAEWIPELA